jgi:hypothetical protein
MNQILERYAPKTYHTDIFESVNKILLTKADFRVCTWVAKKYQQIVCELNRNVKCIQKI